ncbi:MAG: DUF11 domain-containing protein, partial [Thermoleophilia bacterium]|nr:DUF11 domain-containing protein [Thermoleophilia bacterium]
LQGEAPATLAPGASVTYQGTRTLTTCGLDTNTATVALRRGSVTLAETSTANNSASAQVTVACPPAALTPPPPAAAPPAQAAAAAVRPRPARARLSITKRAPRRVVAGQVVRYRITVANRGPAIARGVRLSDAVPDAMGVRLMPAGARLQGGALVWQLGTLRPGQRRTILLELRAAAQGAPVRCNVAAVSARNAAQVQARACSRVSGLDRPDIPEVTG